MPSVPGCLVQTAKIVLSILVILSLAALGYALLTASDVDPAGRIVGLVAIFYCAIFSPAFLFYCLVLQPRQRW
jgi:VIT1/CCC1 family predicted Fe2+/Mn2+ transporter